MIPREETKMQSNISLKQTIVPSLKHPNCGKISGYSGTAMTLSSLLLETFMAAYGRMDYRNSTFGLRVPIASTDKKYMLYSFVLPKNAVIQKVKTFGYRPVMLSEGSAANTFVISAHDDTNKYYEGHEINNDLSEKIGKECSVHQIKVPMDVYRDGDFFPFVITWKNKDGEEYDSCLCFYNLDYEQQNMSDFAAKYLSFLSQECIGLFKVMKRATVMYKNGNFSVEGPVLKQVEYKTAEPTTVHDRKGEEKVQKYVFKKLDHLMLPSVRYVNDKLQVFSMNDFDTLDVYVKYLSATLRHFINLYEESLAWSNPGAASSQFFSGIKNLFGAGNMLKTIKYQPGMEFAQSKETLNTPVEHMILFGSKVKGSTDRAIDNEIYVCCRSSTFNRMIFGPVPIWHSRPNSVREDNSAQERYSSYGNGCISLHFIKRIYAEIETFWINLTSTEFKDSVFSSVVGFTSNEIDDMIFEHSPTIRSKAANNSSFADALIYHYNPDGHMNVTTMDQIRSSLAAVYRKVFGSYIEFLYTVSGFNQFKNPKNIHDIRGYEVFVRINQAPHKIQGKVVGVSTMTALGRESHDEHTVKLSYMIVTGQHSNQNFFTPSGETTSRVKTHNRADGGIFMAIENSGHTISEDDVAVRASPFSKPARDAYLVSSMLGGHVDFFIPSVLQSKRVSATRFNRLNYIQTSQQQQQTTTQERTVNILEINHRYPENLAGAQIDPKFYVQHSIGAGNFAANVEVFCAVPPPTYDEVSKNVSSEKSGPKESFSAKDVLTIKNDWIEYISSIEFIKNIMNRAHTIKVVEEVDRKVKVTNDVQELVVTGRKVIDYSFALPLQIACIIAQGIKDGVKDDAEDEIGKDAKHKNIFQLIRFYEKKIGQQDKFMTLGTFDALVDIAQNSMNNRNFFSMITTELDQIVTKELGAASVAQYTFSGRIVYAKIEDGEVKKKLDEVINRNLDLSKLAQFYKEIFPNLYTNFYKNTHGQFRIYRLKVISEAIFNFYHTRNFEDKQFTYQNMINAVLLISDYNNERSERASYYTKEQYMAMSASVYLGENLQANQSTSFNIIRKALFGKIPGLKMELHYNALAKKLAANPVFANIANVPMMRHADKTYVHLLNDMCSVNSNSMYYFIKCLSNHEGENYRFDFITGFVKRREAMTVQQKNSGTEQYNANANSAASSAAYLGVVEKIRIAKEEVSFDDLHSFLLTVDGAMARAERGKYRVATDYVIARFSHNRSFMNGISPSGPRTIALTDNRIESLHADFRTFYQRSGHMPKEDLIQRERNLVEEFLRGSA